MSEISRSLSSSGSIPWRHSTASSAVLLFMQLNYDWARCVSVWSAVMSGIRAFFSLSFGGVLWMASSSISRMCLGLFRDVKTKDVSSIFTVYFVFSSLGRIFGLLSRTSPDLRVLITNRTSVERHSRFVLMWQCFNFYSLRRLNISGRFLCVNLISRLSAQLSVVCL